MNLQLSVYRKFLAGVIFPAQPVRTVSMTSLELLLWFVAISKGNGYIPCWILGHLSNSGCLYLSIAYSGAPRILQINEIIVIVDWWLSPSPFQHTSRCWNQSSVVVDACTWALDLIFTLILFGILIFRFVSCWSNQHCQSFLLSLLFLILIWMHHFSTYDSVWHLCSDQYLSSLLTSLLDTPLHTLSTPTIQQVLTKGYCASFDPSSFDLTLEQCVLICAFHAYIAV